MSVGRCFFLTAVSVLILAAPLGAGPAWADSGETIELEGGLDERQLDGTASRHWQVMIATLSPSIDSGKLSEYTLLLALKDRAAAYIQIGSYPLALDDCNRALSLDPEYGPALLRRAMIAVEKGQFYRARRDLDLAIAKGGLYGRELAFAYFTRSFARYELDDTEGGAIDLAAAREQDSEMLDHILEYRRMTITRQDYRQVAEVFDE